MPEQQEAGTGASLGDSVRGTDQSGAPAIIAVELEDVSTQVMTTRQLAWRRFRKHKPAMISAVVLIVLGLVAIFAKWVCPHTPNALDLTATYKAPSVAHWFGTDELGRDEFTRVIYGGRISLAVGITVALVSAFVGAFAGGVAGYYGGAIDNALMRVTDLFLSIPFLVILILASKALGNSVGDIVLILTLFFWMGDARIVRGVVLIPEREGVRRGCEGFWSA